MRLLLFSVLIATARALQLPNKFGANAGARVSAAATGVVASLPSAASAVDLPALPPLPAPPAWLESKEVHDLAIFFAQTVI